MEKNEYLLEVKGLKKYFKVGKGTLKAVDDVSFYIRPGETLGVVGESGCGKTTCGRTVLGLYDRTDGEVLYRGKDVHKLKGEERKQFTKHAQIIFQDPYASLDPKMKVQDIIAEGIRAHGLAKSEKEIKERVNELLVTVGLNAQYGERYIHEFSGGQRQRIGIARALAARPEILLMDEPFGAVDEITRGQLQQEIRRIHEDRGITILFVTHDIEEALKLGSRVLILDQGKIEQYAAPEEILQNPATEFVKQLVSSCR